MLLSRTEPAPGLALQREQQLPPPTPELIAHSGAQSIKENMVNKKTYRGAAGG